MKRDQHFWARAVFVAAVIIGVTFLAAKYARASVGNVGKVGQLMAPTSAITINGGGENPFGLATESGQFILTESNQQIVTEASP